MTLENNEPKVDETTVKEIDEVLTSMGVAPTTAPAASEPPAVEPPKEPPVEPVPPAEPPKEPLPVEPTAPPAAAAPPAGAPPAAAPVVPPTGTPPAEDEVTRLKRENDEFRQQLVELAAFFQGGGKGPAPKTIAGAPPAGAPGAPPAPGTQPSQPTQPAAAPTRGAAVIPFFAKNEDIDESFKDAQSANMLMTKVVAMAVEYMSRNLPPVVERLSSQSVNTRLAVNEFYTNNPDLFPYKEYCGFLTNKIIAEDPNITLGNLFEKLGKDARAALKLVAAAGGTVPAGGDPNNIAGAAGSPPAGAGGPGPALPPAGAGGGGRKSGPPALEGVEKEIADMMKLEA